ncbi:MAG TPA: protein kinase [Ktedonobacteraceae bacterium]|nr:protein kinase [Ktedonobacteraceae bacterium]
MARCLNPHGGHENPHQAVSCQRCGFLVEGAHIGHYEVLSFIGTGSYGNVYKVREPAPLGRILALKVLRIDQFNEKALSSFFDEARRIANLQHPNILPVFNFGQLEDGRPYLVMEYAPRTINDLFRRLDGTKRLALAEELVPYIEQTASALYYLHEHGLIHQDVKPSNLLIGRNGQILLSDFGTAFYLGQQTHASLDEATGTAVYMPPEQWRGTPRRESDQYALAICCYELLAGRAPFVYRRIEEMWNAHINEAPPSPQHWNTRIPVEVAAVLQRALAKDYHQRYRSMLEFSDAYASAVRETQARYVCQRCGMQNRTGAQRCSGCGAENDDRHCPFCGAPARFGQRVCSTCGRLIFPPNMVPHSPLAEVSVRQGRYIIKHVLQKGREAPPVQQQTLKRINAPKVTVAIAEDTQHNNRRVILKRWECTEAPLSRRARDFAHYERATEALARLNHPLIPHVLDRFAEGKYYYMALEYIKGESLEERLQKLLRPLAEHDITGYMNNLLNVFIALEQQRPPLRHFDISPANIIIGGERGRERAYLTGFQVPPPSNVTRKLPTSPYLPARDAPYDQRTCIYMLAASMHQALTNYVPEPYPASTPPLPVHVLNPAVSPTLEAILNRALQEDREMRYQTFEEMQRDLRRLL